MCVLLLDNGVAFVRHTGRLIELPTGLANRRRLGCFILIIIFVYCRLTHATEQKILPQQAEISGIIVT